MGNCTALNLNDSTQCVSPATNKNNLFCELHARQVQGLYQGYKRRSKELDDIEKKQPKSLPKNLGNANFSELNDPEALRELHAFLLRRFNLTTRCVLARDYHHSNFYKDTSDFGHQVYLDRLRSSRVLHFQALHRLEKRMLDVACHATQWYAWVESLQTEADNKSEAEKKKVKAEAALFKKHQMNVGKFREEEELRQRSELEKVDVWDPIESIIESTRAGYIALIKVMVLAEGTTQDEMVLAMERGLQLKTSARKQIDTFELENIKRSRDRKAMRIGPERKKYQDAEEERDKRMAAQRPKAKVESDDETDADVDGMATVMAEFGLPNRSLISNTEGQEHQVRVISEFVLLRLVIADPSLLVTAMASPSIDAFFRSGVRNTDLRDLCLDLSRPSFKLMKNACLDYWVAEAMKGQDDGEGQALAKVGKGKGKGKKATGTPLPNLHPDRLALWRENKVKVCGKWIYNLPPKFTLPCQGWSQFSMMATNCSLWDAISICTSWNEFFELNILTLNGCLRNWSSAREPPSLQNLRRLGFVSYSQSSDAARATGSTQIGGRRGRVHKATEARNYLCANVSREPGSWRFINLIQTYKSLVVVYVRDCLTGQVICAPPDEEKWLIRDKEGTGKLNKGKWVVRQSFDRAFRTKIEEIRPWKLQFNEYLDVVIWDRHPGWNVDNLHMFLIKMLNKAHKYKDAIAMMEPTLRVLSCASTGKVGHLARDYARSKLSSQLQIEYGGLEAFPDMYYDSVDEEIDGEYKPYERKTRSDKEIEEEEDDEDDEDDEDNEDDEDDEDDEDGEDEDVVVLDKKEEVWVTASWEAYDLLAAVAELFKSLAVLRGEPVIDIDTTRQKNMEYDKSVKFLEDISNSRKKVSRETKFEGIHRQRDLVNTMNGCDHDSHWVGITLTGLLWGGNPGMEAGLWSSGAGRVTMLRNVEARAQNPPPRRPPVCPENVYAEWDRFKGSFGGGAVDVPKEHERVIRRTLMRLWKFGIVKPSWSLEDRHVAFAGRARDDGDYHMYIDYRHLVRDRILVAPILRMPPGTHYLRDQMEIFENENPGATYSLVRIMSEPDYWQATMSYNDSQHQAMIDPLGRVWEWAYTPKDLPFCEWTISELVSALLTDTSSDGETGTIGENVRSRTDTVLVMGKDEETCKVWTTKVVGLISRRVPHMFDPDFARSFLKVDAGFLRRLPEVWWE